MKQAEEWLIQRDPFGTGSQYLDLSCAKQDTSLLERVDHKQNADLKLEAAAPSGRSPGPGSWPYPATGRPDEALFTEL